VIADQSGQRWTPPRVRAPGPALTCIAYVGLGTVLWAAYGEAGRDVRRDRPPIVSADATPVKLRSAERRASDDLAQAAPAPDPIPEPELKDSRALVPVAADPAAAAPTPAGSAGAARPEPIPEPGLPESAVVVTALASNPAPAMPPPSAPIEARAARHALAALEALHGAIAEPIRGPRPEPPDPVSASDASGTRPSVASDVRAGPPLAPSSRMAPAPLPVLKPLQAAAVLAAADASTATPPPLPAFKPASALAAAAAGTEPCGATIGNGVLPADCGSASPRPAMKEPSHPSGPG
jgi:hypothetical protein